MSKKKLTSKAPAEALAELKKHFTLQYIINDGCVTYTGFDISSLGNEPIAEVISLNDLPVQVRLLKEAPYKKRTFFYLAEYDFKFGGF